MYNVNDIFFELICLSIGTRERLSRVPTDAEWEMLYSMAAKQSLLGICMAGVKRHVDSAVKEGAERSIPTNVYFQWVGAAARIQECNKRLDERCADFEQKLAADGYQSCVLKGQGLAALYGELRAMRTPGDIDVWAIGKPTEIIEWARRTGTLTYFDYHHADLSMYKETEIELHYRPSLSRNLLRNARLQRWFKDDGAMHMVFREDLGFSVPDYVFNVVLVLNHNFWHLMYEGVGLRQILDLFFLLRSADKDGTGAKEVALKWIKHFRLQHFASASMWIMKEVLGLEERFLLCRPDENAGRFLQNEIMQAGNFGKFDPRLNKDRYQSRFGLMLSWVKHNLRLIRHYPEDVLWTPVGILRISFWRRWYYRRANRA